VTFVGVDLPSTAAETVVDVVSDGVEEHALTRRAITIAVVIPRMKGTLLRFPDKAPGTMFI
jgi:hypothetical protein